MRAGRLRHRLTVQSISQSQDLVTGEIVQGWTDTGLKIWGSIEPLSVREFIEAKAAQGEVSARVLTRWNDGIDESMRLVNEKTGTAYEIKGPPMTDTVSNRHYMTLMVGSGVKVVP